MHQTVAKDFLLELSALFKQKAVELRGCPETCRILSFAIPAAEEDWETEYLGPILAVKVVRDMDEAIAHINRYGSHHTDAIVTGDYSRSRRFLREVDW